MSEATLDLLPETPPTARFVGDLDLNSLPQNDQLYGEPPDRSFIESVKRVGVTVPILVEDTNYPPYHVIAGRRRIKAARAAGLTHIPAMVYPHGTITDVLTLIENAERSQNAVSDLESIETLIRQGADEAMIGKATGMSVATIRKRLKLANLLPAFRQQLRVGTLNVSLAQRIARLRPNEQEQLLQQQAAETLTGKIVAERFKVRKQSAAASLPDSMFGAPDLEDMATPQPMGVTLDTLISERDRRYLDFLRQQHPGQDDKTILGCALYLQAVRKGWKE